MNTFITDVLVVGAGMAGLTTAAYLSKAGFKVTLCDKGKITGGLVNSFDYKGFVFDGGIRSIENSGIVFPMLKELGLEIDFLPSTVSVGLGKDVVHVTSKDSLAAYQDLLERAFPESKQDIANILQEITKVMTYMDVMYGIDNPLFMDIKNNPAYALRTVLPWALKYMMTVPKITKLNKPVYEHLSTFSKNQSLLDIICQHFFTQTPAFFALSYFSLYLDYHYPRGGTGALPGALEQLIRKNNAEIKFETEITSIDPPKNQADDSKGNHYRFKKLVWTADQKTLYRVLNLSSLTDVKVTSAIQKKKALISGKVGGDSVLTLYLTTELDPSYFAKVSGPHFFYTPSLSGLSNVKLAELLIGEEGSPSRFTPEKTRTIEWIKRFLDLTTYEISIPVLRDKTLAPEGKTGLIVSTLFDYALTKHIESLDWYEDFKELVMGHIIRVLHTSIYPGLEAAVMDGFVSTPLTIEKSTGNSDGAITGWAFTNSVIPAVTQLPKVADSVLTPIPNTYQAGQWTYSPSGMPISILTGKLAADRVLKDLAKDRSIPG